MAGLPEGWEADYDGARWFYRYKATEMVQYHFPQPGDEFAEFLADAGTGPFRLTPEERLAVEQESKRKNASNSADNTEIGARTNGGPSGKKKTEVFDDETPMSANGYFDPSSFMYFPGAHDDLSPLEDEESIRTPQISHPSVGGKGGLTINTSGSNVQVVAVELPEGERQIWSPVGHVAELATQETLRCAEELAPVELDGASLIIAPITTDMTQGLAELPTHRSPVEEKAIHVEPPRPQHVMQPVDSLPLVSASFAYPPLRADVNPGSSVSSNPSISKDTGASSTDPVDPRHGKHQQLQPGQVAGDERTSADGDGVGASTQTSVLQNQESELGIVAQNSPENDKVSIVGGKHDNSRPSTTLSELIAAQTSSPSHDVGSIPEALQPARPPAQAPVPLETSLQHSTQAKHDNTPASIGAHNLSHTPSVLRPGGSQPKPGLQEGEGNGPQNVSGQYTDDGMPSRPAFAQAVSLTHYGQAHITKVNTLPGRLPSTIPSPPKMNGSPGFLFFHEIPSAPNPPNQNSTPGPQIPSNSTPIPSTSYQTQNNLQSTLTADHQDAVVAPLGFVKPNSTTSSEPVSAAPETDDSSSHSGQPASPSSDQISEVISLIDNFTTSGTSIPSSQHHQSPDHAAQGGNNTPNPTSVTEGTGSQLQDGANIRPQPTNKLSSTLAEHTISTTADVSTSISVTPAPMAQTVVKPPPNDTGNRPTHGPTDTMTSQHPPVPNQGIPIQYQNPSPSPLPLTNSLSNVSTAPGKPESQGQPVNSTATITHGANNTQTNQFQSQPHRPSISYMNNSAQQQPQAQIVATNANKPVQTNGTTFIHQASHQPYGQSIASHPAVRPPTIGHHQTTSQSPNLQQPSATRPPSLPPQPHQQSSSMTHSVSPVPSQVSSPAQSIASLDVSTVSTPSTAFAAMNASMNSPSSHNSWSNAPARPPSVPAHAFAHQGGNLRPHANSNPIAPPATGAAQGLSSPTGSSPGKPFPMLPGQVIPLPSQIGSAPRPPLAQQPMANNHANVAATAQQTGNVVQPAQPISGGLSQHHGAPAQANPILNSPHGNVPYKPNPPPTQMKPPQQQTFTSQPGVTHNGMNNPLANQPRPPQQQQLQQQQQQQHQMVSYPSTAAPGQPQNQHMIPRPPVGRPPVTGHQPVSQPQMTQPQHLVQSPGFSSPVNAAQAKPFTSAQATAGLQEVGKGMKKWAKKMLKNPALKQTAVGFGGAVSKSSTITTLLSILPATTELAPVS
ncbi:hypothetical protein F4777DRAFT_537770 [Nemania sp. FL0916]|nr:hypothetical protein F4777DRAFT_537770 [Nemania sp. FL0916]